MPKQLPSMEREDGGFAWSSTHNSCFEISKLAVLHASRCTQCNPENPRKWTPLDRPLLRLQGKMVKEVKSYKYLGIHMDAQLRWTIQVQKGIANGGLYPAPTFHMDSTWNPCNSRWIPPFHMEYVLGEIPPILVIFSMHIPYGMAKFHLKSMESIWNIHMEFTWNIP